MYSCGAMYSTTPLLSSGRWALSLLLPSWSRWQKYAEGTSLI